MNAIVTFWLPLFQTKNTLAPFIFLYRFPASKNAFVVAFFSSIISRFSHLLLYFLDQNNMSSAQTSQRIINDCGVFLMSNLCVFFNSQNAPINYYPCFTLMQGFRNGTERKIARSVQYQTCAPNIHAVYCITAH